MLELFSDPRTGRGLKCSRAVERGSVVISSEPFVYLLSRKHRGLRCDHCFSTPDTLLRCSGCKFLRYCNRSCQRTDWPCHKQECSALRRVAPKVPSDFVILVGRVLWKLQNSTHDHVESLVSVLDLESNYDRLTDRQKETLGHCVTVLHSYWGLNSLPHGLTDIRSILGLCAKLKNNSFAVCNEELQSDIGTGVYLNCSLINHSCIPNCVAVFDGLKLNVRAIRDLHDGEEILISYIDQLAPTQDRKDELQGIYRFDCMCNSCLNKTGDDKMLSDFDGTVLTTKSAKIISVKSFLEDLKKLQEAGKFEEVQELTTSYISRKVLPAENVYMARVHDFLMDACVQLGRYKDAFAHGAIALASYKKYLQEIHPLSGIQMMKLGKLLLYLSKNSEAIHLLLEASKILQITHGRDSNLLQELQTLINQCRLEEEAKEMR